MNRNDIHHENPRIKTQGLMIFLGIAFVVGWVLQGIAIKLGFHAPGGFWLLLTMWAPMLGAILAGRQTRSQVWTGIKRAGWRFWPVAFIVGCALSGGQQIMLWVLHAGHWNSSMFPLNANGTGIASIHQVGVLLGAGSQNFGFFSINVALSIFVAAVLTMVIGAIGEEAGWRGILQPEMVRRFGVIKGTLLVGLIWGYWHLPVNLAGYNDARHPVIQALVLFPVFTTSLAFVLAWLVKASGSLWPCALAHQANNTLNAGQFMLANNWFFDQLTSIVVAVVIGVFFAWLLYRHETQEKSNIGQTKIVMES